ncbi:uncharacterized protein M421DRAFT_423538 [Didymella exigua CBS 183.55]|uniref:Uncharacterized protein n=1 Tax=Didymella exigua CBS 183.55 TaxID=1150837 RepID=A0A6A5RDF6_9PLEO|nr:uncharacterized protein M421DRAFT_423538 [Didymella exigua CBS 183.55]KAF1925702.1 hypothetical protein M421DRAFT_423538 [Didymella exigua CBS 183.55]
MSCIFLSIFLTGTSPKSVLSLSPSYSRIRTSGSTCPWHFLRDLAPTLLYTGPPGAPWQVAPCWWLQFV